LKFWRAFSIALIVFLPVFLISSGAMEYGLDPYSAGHELALRYDLPVVWDGMCISFSLTIVLSAREKTNHAINLPTNQWVQYFQRLLDPSAGDRAAGLPDELYGDPPDG
jgi:hypothetical protein